MAIDTYIVYAGVYPDLDSAEADYALVKELFSKENLVDAYDAAIVERRADGKVKLGKKHETPTRAGGVLGGGVGLATGLVLVVYWMAHVYIYTLSSHFDGDRRHFLLRLRTARL